MSEYGPNGSPPGQGAPPPLPSAGARFDLNGNPLPSEPGQSLTPAQQGYVPPPPSYAPPPPPSYAPPPASGYNPPPSPGYMPGQNPPPYGQQYAAPPRNDGGGLGKIGWYVAIGFAVVAVLFMFVLGRATKPPMIDAPTVYKPVDSPDKSFSCIAPDNWASVGSGSEGSQMGGLMFVKGPVRIDITSSDALSYMGDAMRPAAPADGESDPNAAATPPPPVEAIHKMTENDFSEKYDGYVEMPEQKLQDQFGDTRVSEWTAKGGMFTGNLRGYRVTMLGLNKAITIDCHCPEQNWTIMQPVFLKVIQSIVPGNG